jgi:malate synthase
VVLADSGETVTKELVSRILDEEVGKLREQVPAEQFETYYVPAKKLIADLVLSDDFTDFLTLPAYELVK